MKRGVRKEDNIKDLNAVVVENISCSNYELKPTRKTITGEQLLNKNIEKLPCLLNPILPKIGVAALCGSSDTGKSSFLRNLAINISLNKPDFIGFPLECTHNKVIYVSTEDNEESISYLLKKQKEAELPCENYRGIRYLFDTEKLTDTLEKELSFEPADCVIIDTFSDLFTGDINATNKVRSFIQNYDTLAKKHKCLFLFLHHLGKRKEDLAPSKHGMLGSQGFEAKMRAVLELRKNKSDSSKRNLHITKGNYLKEEYKNGYYELDFSDKMLFTYNRIHINAPAEDRDKKNELKNRALEFAKKARKDGATCEQTAKLVNEKLNYEVSSSTISSWTKGI